MIIYRPHRGSLHNAMLEKKEFETIEDMFVYIHVPNYIDICDIFLSEDAYDDDRIGWKQVHHVCIYGYTDYNGNYISYDMPQCIGMCSYNYNN